MTYKDLIDLLETFARNHAQIERWGYGNISDIEVPTDSDGKVTARAYPYMFINPSSHSIGERTITYNFNIIQMHLASEETPTGKGGVNTEIQAQSDALEILRDLMGYLRTHSNADIDVIQSGSVTPFKERYQDTVSGMTLALQIQVATPLSNCNIPGL